MKKNLFILFLILPFFFFSSPGLSQENNKIGIHISQLSDLSKAQELVNSNGGDWGYVTIVIQKNDLEKEKWQNFFNLCREKHLIPLVRIATLLENEVWQKPDRELLLRFSEFLNSLNWPVKNRYIIVFNEPNHDKEWGGEVNPEEYAQILDQAITIFKEKNPNFFILNAGFDQAAPNSSSTMDEEKFLREMNYKIPELFSKLDGWASHSYPNHGFVGKPWEKGRRTIKGYKWEISLLKKMGVRKDLPIFITETGWPHREPLNSKIKNYYYDQKIVADFIKQAFLEVWLPEEKIMAITPFILNYPYPPFANFSWLDENNNPYPQFEAIKNIEKEKGNPPQEEKYEIIDFFYPEILPSEFTFKGKITLKNTGQSIWGEKDFKLEAHLLSNEKSHAEEAIKITNLILPRRILVKPGEKWTFNFFIETLNQPGNFEFSWGELPKNKITVFKIPKLENQQQILPLGSFLKIILNFWYNLIGILA